MQNVLSFGVFTQFGHDEIERRFWRITSRVLLAFVVIGIVLPLLPVWEIPREQKIKVPERVAKVMMERRLQQEKPKPKPLPPAPKPEKAKDPLPKKTPKPKTEKPKPVPVPKASVKERVAKVGLLAMRDELASLRETPVLNRLTNPNKTLSNAGSEAAVRERKPVTRVVNKGSGGVSTKSLDQQTVQTQLSERELTQVKSSITSDALKEGKGSARVASRGIEEIQLILERHKGSFNILYNKQLRQNPGLRGKVLFELTIAPSGKVISCKVLESELNFPKLERKFVLKLKSIDFGEKDVETTIVNYPIDFFPS